MWGRDIPNPTLLGAFGARSWPLNFNSWIRLFEHGIICIASIHSMPGQCMGTLGRLSVEYYYSLSLLRRSHHSRLIRQVLTSLRFDLCTALHGRSAKSAAILPRHPHMHPPRKVSYYPPTMNVSHFVLSDLPLFFKLHYSWAELGRRKILAATRCHILRPKCTQFDFGPQTSLYLPFVLVRQLPYTGKNTGFACASLVGTSANLYVQ